METKKSAKANLENGKSISLLMGLVVAIAVLFVSFEWGTRDVKILTSDRDGSIEWVDEIPFTMTQPTPPPPPPKVIIAESLNVVDDKMDVSDSDIPTTEDTEGTPQPETFTPPAPVDDEEEVDPNIVFTVVEDMPEFPGGEGELLKFINKSIKYPVIAQENDIQGRVVCAFVVNRDGSVVDAEILRGVDPSLDKEALRVINTMPKWTPGMQRGKPVRVKYTVPITFRLK